MVCRPSTSGIVHTGEFSDPATRQAVGDILIKRRNAIVATYLAAVNPIVAPHLTNDAPCRCS